MTMLPGRRNQRGDAADQLQRREDDLGAPVRTRFGQAVEQPLRVELLQPVGGDGRMSAVAQQPFQALAVVGLDAHARIQREPAAVVPRFHLFTGLRVDPPTACVFRPNVTGFVMYDMSAKLQGLAFHGVSLTPDFELDEAAMAQAMRQHRPAIVYLAYPNNPTANAWQRGAMQRLIALAAELGSLVVVDEAYQPFASQTWLDEIRAAPQLHSHVLLMRTLSKFGLAGIRLGYMVGPQALIAELDKVCPPYNVSVLNAECALFALEHQEVFAQQAAEIRQQRDHLLRELAALPGFTPYPSQANMILVRVPDAARIFAGLKAQGVLVKNVSTMHPTLTQCLRLTVGTPEENTRLLQALAAI